MKKLLYSIACLFIAIGLAAQIPNADFENWDNQPVPLQWETNSRPLTLPAYDPYVVKKDTDSYTGSYAANLTGNGVFKPYVKTTFAVLQHPSHVSLYYSLLFGPCVNDSAYFQQDTVSVLTELLNNGTVVDSGYWQSKTSSLNYSVLNVPVTQNATTFDSFRITITGGKILGGCGIVAQATSFRVDHLQLKYGAQSGCIDSSLICTGCFCPAIVDPVCGCDGVTYLNSCEANNRGVSTWTSGQCTTTGVGEIQDNNIISVWPVPAHDKLNISYQFKQTGNTTIRLINMLGQSVKEFLPGSEDPSEHDIQIDTKGLPAGMYVLEVNNGNEKKVIRVVKQ